MSLHHQYRTAVATLIKKQIEEVAEFIAGGVDQDVYWRNVGHIRGLRLALEYLQRAEDELYGRTPLPEDTGVTY